MTTTRKATRAEMQAALAEADASGVADFGAAQRKRHLATFKEDRQRLSDSELMFESLADLFGFDPDERETLHLFTARAMDKSPDEPLIVNEKDIGRQLGDDDDVTEESFKRRTVRAAEAVEARANSRGRSVLKRQPGKWSVEAGKDSRTGAKLAAREEKKVGARYFYFWPQAIAEGVQTARALRAGNRRGRFRRAAEVVFDSEIFPKVAPPKAPAKPTPHVRDAEEVAAEVSRAETHELLTGERPPVGLKSSPAKPESPMRIPRTVRRMKDNAALALRAARERDEKSGGGSKEFNRQAAWLAVELVRTIEREQGGGDLPTGEAIRQAIELLRAVESDPAELVLLDASLVTLEASNTQDNSGASDMPDKSAPDLTPLSSEPVLQNSGQKRKSGSHFQDSAVQKNRAPRLIPAAVVDEVRARADIVDVMERRGVKLKRAGSEWKGCCPFHKEKTASFSVNRGKGFYKCFGCGKSGDVFGFVVETDGGNFRDAVLTLAGECGVPLPDEVTEPAERPRAERAPRDFTVEPDPDAQTFAEDYEL